jgi:hypothetical protein
MQNYFILLDSTHLSVYTASHDGNICICRLSNLDHFVVLFLTEILPLSGNQMLCTARNAAEYFAYFCQRRPSTYLLVRIQRTCTDEGAGIA